MDHPATPQRDDRGATAVEYALMISFIAMAIVAAVGTLGTTVASGFQPVIDMFLSII